MPTHMPRHYEHAPIAEAIIDLRVEWPSNAPEDVFDRLAEQLSSRFPKCEPMHAIAMGFKAQAGEAVSFDTNAQLVGRRLDTPSGDRVLQLQRAGFTYSHMPPYSDWAAFGAEAQELWQAFASAAGIATVTRAAVRVVNKIALPGGWADLPKYTTLLPTVPKGALDGDGAYFLQLQRAGAVEGSQVIVNSGRALRPDGAWDFLLDFDIFVDQSFDADSPDIWTVLRQLSDAKNELFEACITDEFRGLIA